MHFDDHDGYQAACLSQVFAQAVAGYSPEVQVVSDHNHKGVYLNFGRAPATTATPAKKQTKMHSLAGSNVNQVEFVRTSEAGAEEVQGFFIFYIDLNGCVQPPSAVT